MSFLETMRNYSFSPQDSGGRPPPSFFRPRQPEEVFCYSASLPTLAVWLYQQQKYVK